jgi:hypothetical protein
VLLSSCVLRGIRNDFDKAAQLATLKWRFTPLLLIGKPVGVVMTVTVGIPAVDGKDGVVWRSATQSEASPPRESGNGSCRS